MWFVIGFILLLIGVLIAYVLASAYEEASQAPNGPKIIMVLLLLIGAFLMLGSIFVKLWKVMP